MSRGTGHRLFNFPDANAPASGNARVRLTPQPLDGERAQISSVLMSSASTVFTPDELADFNSAMNAGRRV